MALTLAKDFDQEGKRLAARGVVSKLSVGVFGRRWKKRFAYCDERKLLLWDGDKPGNSDPKTGFNISNCTFTECSADKLYAFEVVDTTSQQKATIALQDARSYEIWHELFTRQSIRAKVTQNKDEALAQAQLQKQLEIEKLEDKNKDDQILTEFFRKRDISSNFPTNPVIKTSHIQKLMTMLDPSTPTNVAHLACRELHIDPKNGSISKSEFIAWWKGYRASIEPPAATAAAAPDQQSSRRGSNVSLRSAVDKTPPPMPSLVEFDTSTDLHYASFLDAELSTANSVTRSQLLETIVPALSRKNDPAAHPEIREGDNWNDVYQRLVGAASQVVSFAPVTAADAAAATKPGAIKGKAAALQKAPTLSRAVPASAPRMLSLHRVSADESAAALKSLAVFQGEFVKEALSGAMLIVDEYLLPASEKSNGVIILSQQQDQQDEPEDEEGEGGGGDGGDRPHPSEEIFGFGGLLFRIAAVAAREQDQEPSAQRSRFVAGADELFHKVAGNEHRHLLAVQQAVRATYFDYCTAHVLKQAELEAQDAVAALGEGAVEVPGAKVYSEAFVEELSEGERCNRPSTLLSAVIDYGGFRVTALCPTNIDEATTLVHGLYQDKGFFVDTMPEVFESLLSRITAKMNLAPEKRLMVTALSPLDDAVLPELLSQEQQLSMMREVDFLGRDFQVHERLPPSHGDKEGLTGAVGGSATKSQFYLVNLRNLLPADIPRSETNDLLTRTLRPELVAGAARGAGIGPLCCDALSSVNEDVITSHGEQNFEGDQEGFWAEYSSPPVLQHISACNHLYTDVIPTLAHVLDEASCLPVDSYSLSKCFHTHGVSMRNLGIVYALVQQPFVQSLLLSEAVARCCKVLLNKTLRDVTRRAKAASLIAEKRHTSSRKDFVELNKSTLSSRRGIVLELFNVVLGSGQASTTFWRNVLPDILFQKFSIDVEVNLAKVDKSTLCHLPQLAQALQYHLGATLADRLDYSFTSVEEAPVREEDVVTCLLPAIKLPSTMPGPLGASLDRAEALMGVGLFRDAAALLRLRLQLYQLMLNDASLPKHAAAVADTLYKIALCAWAEGDFSAVVEVVTRALASRPRLSPLSARMLTLLMAAQFMSGNVADALNTFEDGSLVYMHTLGEQHPAMCLHMTALADCYYAFAKPKQAVLMLTLAHDVARRLLGGTHLLSASYAAKIAALVLAGGGDQLAETLGAKAALGDSLRVFEMAVGRGADRLERHVNDLLYALTVSPGTDLDEAAALAARVVEFQDNHLHVANARSFEPPHVVSAVLLLAEAKLKSRDVPGGIALLERAWEAVKTRPSDYPSIGTTFALISCKILNTLNAALALQTRSLLHTVASEVSEGQHGSATPGAWDNACRVVFNILWEGGTKSYFQAVVDGLIQAEVEAGGGVDEEKSAPQPTTSSRRQSKFSSGFSSRALEIAVIMRLVHYHNHALFKLSSV